MSSNAKSLTTLKNLHEGEVVVVLGSGRSAGYFSPAFFANWTTISSSESFESIGLIPDYVFSNHWKSVLCLSQRLSTTVFVVNSKEWPSLEPLGKRRGANVILNPVTTNTHPQSSFNPFEHSPNDEDTIIFGSSSLHGAMHLAAYMGAKWILLVGADNSRLDGFWNVGGHSTPVGGYPVDDYERHLRLMKEWLVQRYGCETYSLNPFLNFHLEGHKLSDKRVGDSFWRETVRKSRKAITRRFRMVG